MNDEQEARRDALLGAFREREREAMAATLASARQAVQRGRMGAGSRGGLIGLAVAVLSWPFAHMKQK